MQIACCRAYRVRRNVLTLFNKVTNHAAVLDKAWIRSPPQVQVSNDGKNGFNINCASSDKIARLK